MPLIGLCNARKYLIFGIYLLLGWKFDVFFKKKWFWQKMPPVAQNAQIAVSSNCAFFDKSKFLKVCLQKTPKIDFYHTCKLKYFFSVLFCTFWYKNQIDWSKNEILACFFVRTDNFVKSHWNWEKNPKFKILVFFWLIWLKTVLKNEKLPYPYYF